MPNIQRPIFQGSKASANPFDDPEVATRYERWYSQSGRRADFLEKRLLEKLLASLPDSRSALEIGCGTGHFARWLATRGYAVTGLDVSAAMLAEAHSLNRERLDGNVCYVRGDAHQLPFAAKEFDLALLITTLEFVAVPELALAEAVRVARRGLLVGALNRWSWLGMRYRASGGPIWQAARFFTPWDLARLARAAAGTRLVRMHWRTTIWPVPWITDLPLPWADSSVWQSN